MLVAGSTKLGETGLGWGFGLGLGMSIEAASAGRMVVVEKRALRRSVTKLYFARASMV